MLIKKIRNTQNWVCECVKRWQRQLKMKWNEAKLKQRQEKEREKKTLR